MACFWLVIVWGTVLIVWGSCGRTKFIRTNEVPEWSTNEALVMRDRTAMWTPLWGSAQQPGKAIFAGFVKCIGSLCRWIWPHVMNNRSGWDVRGASCICTEPFKSKQFALGIQCHWHLALPVNRDGNVSPGRENVVRSQHRPDTDSMAPSGLGCTVTPYCRGRTEGCSVGVSRSQHCTSAFRARRGDGGVWNKKCGQRG